LTRDAAPRPVVRMADVAARAGVSAQTVSRVLRNEPSVTAATAACVRAAMVQLGYHGNEAAAALKRGQAHTFGLLFPFLKIPIWSEIAAGAESLAHERGYTLLLCDTSGSLEKESAYLTLLQSYRVAGIIYGTPRCRVAEDAACASLVASSIPIVVISADEHDLPYPHVHTDDTRAGYVAVRHLLDLGRRHISIIGTGGVSSAGLLPPETAILKRIRGARTALQEAGLAADDIAILLTDNTLNGGRAVGDWLLAEDRELPDALFVTTDFIALGILDSFRRVGVQVPEKIAVVSHDGSLASSVSVPSLTTIALPRVQMGRTCIDILMRAAGGAGEGPTHHLLDAEFIVRESTAGIGRVPRSGVAMPLSGDAPWSAWRADQGTDDPVAAPIMALTMWDLFQAEHDGR
jgi:LacI family transcriptional regulator